MDEIIEKRLHFALSVIFLAITNFILRLIVKIIIENSGFTERTKIIMSFFAYALIIISAAMIVLYLMNKTFIKLQEEESTSEKQSLTLKEEAEPGLNLLFQGFTFKNFGSQLKTALIFICIIYIPLDFFSYVIPLIFNLNVLEYQIETLTSSFLGNYLLYDFNLMILMTIIIHFFIALKEEFVFRGYYISVGENKLNKSSVFIYSAFLFGLAHFSYIFVCTGSSDSIFFPFWWFFNALIIGITSAYYYITKKQLWPLIIAHWVNNVLSAIVLRKDLDGASYWQESFLIMYVPIFVLGTILFIIYRKSLIKHTKQIFHLFKDYIIETPKKVYFAIDFIIIIILWLVSIF